MNKNAIKCNHITLDALKDIINAVEKRGEESITVEYLTRCGQVLETPCMICSHVAITIRRADYKEIESESLYTSGISNIGSSILHDIYNNSGKKSVDFDFKTLEDMTDPDKYAREVEVAGTELPYYRWLPHSHLRIAFRLVDEKTIPTNCITLSSLKRLLAVAVNMGFVPYAHRLTETACVVSDDNDKCSHVSVSVGREIVDESGALVNEVLSMDELRAVFAKAGMSFDLSKMSDVTDAYEYEKLVENGTSEPYYYWCMKHLVVVFKIIDES